MILAKIIQKTWEEISRDAATKFFNNIEKNNLPRKQQQLRNSSTTRPPTPDVRPMFP